LTVQGPLAILARWLSTFTRRAAGGGDTPDGVGADV